MNKRPLIIGKAGIYSRKQAIKAAFIVSLLTTLVLQLGIMYGRSREFLAEIPLVWSSYTLFFLLHFVSNLLLFYVLFMYNFYIAKTKSQGRKGPLYSILGTFIICSVLSPLFARCQWEFITRQSDAGMNAFILFNIIKDYIVSLMVIQITYGMNLWYKREQTITANQRLTEENIRVKYEALKNQLDPHFLFNSLNTLNGLIGVDDDKAKDYVDNLSSVFRYTLHSRTTGKLDDEMEFVDSYITLLKIRFGDNLDVRFAVDGKYRQYHILPASLQLLVENAVKHNVISNKKTLCITIETTPAESIIVSNPINAKAEKSVGGIGLANLSTRYALLFNKDINISDKGGVFSVEIPLLKEIDKKINI